MRRGSIFFKAISKHKRLQENFGSEVLCGRLKALTFKGTGQTEASEREKEMNEFTDLFL